MGLAAVVGDPQPLAVAQDALDAGLGGRPILDLCIESLGSRAANSSSSSAVQ